MVIHFLLLINDIMGPVFGLSFAFSGLFLYLAEYTSNRFVVSNKSFNYTSKVYLLTSITFVIVTLSCSMGRFNIFTNGQSLTC